MSCLPVILNWISSSIAPMLRSPSSSIADKLGTSAVPWFLRGALKEGLGWTGLDANIPPPAVLEDVTVVVVEVPDTPEAVAGTDGALGVVTEEELDVLVVVLEVGRELILVPPD